MLQASLSLPGIAGIVLTVGMAVDANILIYERIREELRNGIAPQAAINAGFEKAFSAIADSNVTTLIAGVVLFAFGTGPIRGFAVVLSLGILTSMFTALVGSRALIHLIWGRRAQDRAPVDRRSRYRPWNFSTRRPATRSWARARCWYVVSAVADHRVARVLFCVRGLNLGIDFTGGVVLELEFPQAADLEKVRSGARAGAVSRTPQVQSFGTPRDVAGAAAAAGGRGRQHRSAQSVLAALQAVDPNVELRRTEVVGPQVGAELANKGAPRDPVHVRLHPASTSRSASSGSSASAPSSRRCTTRSSSSASSPSPR